MTWRIQHTGTFIKELARLPKEVRERVEKLAFGDEIKKDPFLGGKVGKMVGYKTYYKIRVGDYRVGLHIDRQNRIIKFMRVLHRKEIYRKFP